MPSNSVELGSEVVTSAACMSDADILVEDIRPDSTEDEDDDDDNDDDLNDNIGDLDCPPPLTRPSMGDIEEALDKLQDLSLFSSFGDEIRSLTLKIETFLNKERTEGLKQSHLTDFFQVVNYIAKYTNSLYGRFYIELTNNITCDNNPVIFFVLSPFLENSHSR